MQKDFKLSFHNLFYVNICLFLLIYLHDKIFQLNKTNIQVKKKTEFILTY